MDLRQYFKKIRDTENGLTDLFPLMVSLETTDGGKGWGHVGRVAEAGGKADRRGLREIGE